MDDDSEEPNLMNFVYDINNLIHGCVTVVQFILGLSYLVGKFVCEWTWWVLLEIWDSFCTASEIIKQLFAAVIELEESMIRGVLLLYYGAGKVVEAFQITLCDFSDFLQDLYTSFLRFLDILLNMTFEGFLLIVVTTPKHICTALAIIGDSAIEITTQLFIFVQNFVIQLFWAPVNVILAFCSLGLRLAKLPGEIITAVPGSAHVGSIVLILIYVIYCKLSFVRFVELIISCCVKLYGLLRRLPNCIRHLFSLRLKSFSLNSQNDYDTRLLGKGICVVCHDNPVCFLANPCNHVCLCTHCVEQLIELDNKCPICRGRVDHYAKVFVS